MISAFFSPFQEKNIQNQFATEATEDTERFLKKTTGKN